MITSFYLIGRAGFVCFVCVAGCLACLVDRDRERQRETERDRERQRERECVCVVVVCVCVLLLLLFVCLLLGTEAVSPVTLTCMYVPWFCGFFVCVFFSDVLLEKHHHSPLPRSVLDPLQEEITKVQNPL